MSVVVAVVLGLGPWFARAQAPSGAAALSAEVSPDAVVVLVLDASASMDKREEALGFRRRREAMREALQELIWRDVYQEEVRTLVYLSFFGDRVRGVLNPQAPHDAVSIVRREDAEAISDAVDKAYLGPDHICRDNQTRLWDTALDRFAFLKQVHQRFPAAQASLLIYTDGFDTHSEHTEAEVSEISRGEGWCHFRVVQPFDVGPQGRGVSIPRLVRVQPNRAELASFGAAPEQQVVLRFLTPPDGYEVRVALRGIPGGSVTPERVRLADVETPVTIRAPPGAEPGPDARLEFTPVWTGAPGDERYVVAVRTVALGMRPAPPCLPPPLEVLGCPGGRVAALPGSKVTLTARSDEECERLVWEWDEGGSRRTSEGPECSFSWAAEGEHEVRVTARSRCRTPDGKPQTATATVVVAVRGIGANFAPVERPIWLDRQPTLIRIEAFGPVEHTQIEVEGTLYQDTREVRHTFAGAGEKLIRALVSSAAGKAENTMMLRVEAPPEVVIAQPVDGSVWGQGESIPAEVRDPASLRDIRWEVNGSPAARGPAARLRLGKPGVHRVRAVAHAAAGGDREFSAEVQVTVTPPPAAIEIAEPANYAILQAGQPYEFRVGNAASFRPGSLKWVFPGFPEPKEGARVQHAFGEPNEYRIDVSGVDAATGEPVGAFLMVTAVPPPANLSIAEPAENARVTVGVPVRFRIARPESFAQVVWEIEGTPMEGHEVEYCFARATETLAVAVKALSLPGGTPSGPATVHLHVSLPELEITHPVENQKCYVGKPFDVAYRCDAPLSEVRWEFSGPGGKAAVPERADDGRPILMQAGAYQVTATGWLTAGAEKVEVAGRRRFVVGIPGVAIRRVPDQEAYPFDATIGFDLACEPGVQAHITGVAWSFGDGTPAIEKPDGRAVSHRYLRRGAYTVSARISFADQTVAEEFASVVLTARAPRADAAVFRDGRQANRIGMSRWTRPGWECPVELVNKADAEGDAVSVVWTHRKPGSESSVPVPQPGAVRLTEYGTHQFTLTLTGPPDENGTALTAEATTAVTIVRNRDWVLSIALTAVVAGLLAVWSRYWLGNAPAGWSLAVIPGPDPVAVLRDEQRLQSAVTREVYSLTRYWSRWRKRAPIPMGKIRGSDHWTRGPGRTDVVTIVRSAGRPVALFTRRDALQPFRVSRARLWAYVLTDIRLPPGHEDRQLGLVVDAKEYRKALRDWVCATAGAAMAAGLTWWAWWFLGS